MNTLRCSEAGTLLHAYGDGELELGRALEMEAHLASCTRCRAGLAGLQALRGALVRHCVPEVPASLPGRVRAVLAPSDEPRPGALLRSPAALAAPGVAALALSLWLAFAPPQRESGEDTATRAPSVRVVYHISESQTASAALRNLANHLNAAPEAKVIVVAHNNGVDFLLRGARDEASVPYETAVREFVRRGVEFRVCYNTLERRHIPAAQVVPGATLVPSGIAEIGRLQSREGYAYMRL